MRIRPVAVAKQTNGQESKSQSEQNLGSVPYSRDTEAGASNRKLPFIYSKYTELCPQACVVRCLGKDVNVTLQLLLHNPDRECHLIRPSSSMIPCSHKRFYGSDYED
jgi:hypothetical protein